MLSEDYKWNFDYVRLAWDTGFCFGNRKSTNLEKSKICKTQLDPSKGRHESVTILGLVDIEEIIKETDIATVDKHISTILNYVLDNEQAELLDNNFVKMFQISQLAVEYLLFCKKYLDNTVVLLKKELGTIKEVKT